MQNGPKMLRCEMQREAMAIEALLNAAMAIHASPDPEQGIDQLDLIEMATTRANRLSSALDVVNAPEVVA